MMYVEAMERAKQGEKVARDGWRGEGEWVVYMPPFTLPRDQINARTCRHLPNVPDTLRVGGYFVVWTADGVWQPGWEPSPEDILTDDWRVVSAPPA